MLKGVVEHGTSASNSRIATARSALGSDDHRAVETSRQHEALVADHAGITRSRDVGATRLPHHGSPASPPAIAAQHDRHTVAPVA
jgi:hypothetical protein